MKTVFPTATQTHPFAERVVAKLFGTSLEQKYYKDFFSKTPTQNTPSQGRILMYVGISDMYISPIEILMYHIFQSRGFHVDYLVYGPSPLLNEIVTQERVEREGAEAFWRRSHKRGENMLRAANVNYSEISSHLEVENILSNLSGGLDEIFNFSIDKYEVGSIVKGAMYRYYKSLSFGEDAEEVAKKFLKTTLTNYFQTKNLCEKNDYDFVLFSHGIYCTWQVVEEYCRNNGIDYLCYDRAKTKAHANFTLNTPAPVWNMNEPWERLKSRQLTQAQNARVDSYMKERELQKGDVYSYNPAPKSENLDRLKSELGISPSAKVITVFTNLIWDAANVSRDLAFSSPLECIIDLAKNYTNKEQVHILVRCHPAETVLGTKERYGSLVADQFNGHIPDNLTIVEPEMEINSFSMIDISDIGVVHTSTVGIEIAMLGKPVILISETHYREKGFTTDATSKSSFFQSMDTLLSSDGISSEQVELARNYFHLMMFEYQHPMPLDFTNGSRFNGYGFWNFADLIENEREGITRIVDALVSGKRDFVFSV